MECYAELVDNNSESKEFLDAYVTAKKDGDKTCTDFSVYKELREKYPKSQAIEVPHTHSSTSPHHIPHTTEIPSRLLLRRRLQGAHQAVHQEIYPEVHPLPQLCGEELLPV